jgi:hypothetical protein
MLRVSGILIEFVADMLRWLRLAFRSSQSIQAENLFLRRQLALYIERGVKPRRIDAVTRIDLYLLSRLFDWRDSLVVVRVMSNYTDDTRRDQPDSVASHESCRSIYSVAMSSLLQPLHLLLMMFAGWVNRHQLDMIDYLQEENRVLKERLGGRRIHFTDAERRRLARKAYALGRKVLNELETLVTPDTLLRWHRQLVASKWNYTQRRGPGRPHVMQTIVDLILRGKYFVGIHTDPRRAGQSGASGWPRHHRQRPPRTRHRTCS